MSWTQVKFSATAPKDLSLCMFFSASPQCLFALCSQRATAASVSTEQHRSSSERLSVVLLKKPMNLFIFVCYHILILLLLSVLFMTATFSSFFSYIHVNVQCLCPLNAIISKSLVHYCVILR